MAAPVRLDDVDPLFAALTREIYGDSVDVRELWAVSKSMPDSSGVSVPAAMTPNQQKKRKALVGGLLLGTVAEGAATAHAAKDLVGGARATGKLARVLAPASTKGKVAALGLQAVNMGVGLAAARELVKKPKPVTPTAGGIAKRRLVRIPHMAPEGLVRADSRARRAGLRLVGATGAGAAAGGGFAAGRHTRPPRVTPTVTGEVVKKLDLVFHAKIEKFDTDKRQIFGWANLAIVDGKPVVDLQGDYVSIDEIEKSAYGYMLNSRVGGHMHKRIGKALDGGAVHVADVIESFVVTPEKLAVMGLAPDALPLGWWTGMQVFDEDVWQRVKRGELTGLSIHGTGTRREMAMA